MTPMIFEYWCNNAKQNWPPSFPLNSMRIFLSCQQALQRHKIPSYSFWEVYFKKGIEETNFEWVEADGIDWAEGLAYYEDDDLKQWRDYTWSRTVEAIKRHHSRKRIDLFLSYLFPKQVDYGAIRDIQALGIPCVNFFCDNVRHYTKVPRSFHCFDLHWVPEFKAISMYKKAKLSHVYAPMPVWVPPNHRTWEHPENYGVSFIGSRDIQREALLAKVLAEGITDVEIRGAAWETNSNKPISVLPQSTWRQIVNQRNFVLQQGLHAWIRKIKAKSLPRISDETFAPSVKPKPDSEEYVKIIQRSVITLGINRYPSFQYSFLHPNTYSRMRDIEAPMMGACYLTEWTEGLSDLYELGEEIETYKTAEEMIEKIKELKSSPGKRKRLRRKAQRKALNEHSLSKSLKKIAHHLNISS